MVVVLRHLVQTGLMLAWVCLSPSFAQMTSEPPFEFEVKRGIVYGQGLISDSGNQISRDLWMDAYLPSGADGPRPAVIYTHGGSFHIGSPRTSYRVDGAQTTSPADYCRLFAGIGYACFAIQYRLGPEEPVASGAGYEESQLDRNSISLMMDRVGTIRKSLGLRPLDDKVAEDQQLLSDTVLAAAEDLRSALDFVIKNSGDFNVDPDRIVLGGFSAGAVTTLNVGHGMNAPVSGIFMLSAAPIGIDIFKTVTPTSNSAPALLFVGQYDLSGAIIAVQPFMGHYNKIGIDSLLAWVPGFGHFYPAGATSLGADGSRMSVEERILQFVDRVTKN